MGQELIACVLEFPKGRKNPNWEAAEKHLEKLKKSSKKLREAYIEASGDDGLDAILSHQAGVTDSEIDARIVERLQTALENVKVGWDNGLRGMARLTGVKTRMLIAADRSWGDNVEEVDDLIFFDMSGMAKAAGFL